MKYEQFLELYNAGPEPVYKLLLSIIETNKALVDKVSSLSQQVALQDERIKELESQLNKNSRNSSKPPSTDEFVKPKSQRKKSGKSSGGQKGHKGHHLKMSDHPDRSIVHTVKSCLGCGKTLEGISQVRAERRQVYDIPLPKVEVVEHLVESKVCPCCGMHNKASFPDGVTHPVQYGKNLKGLLVYLNQYQLLPYERLVELMHDLFGHTISEGTLFNTNRTVYEALKTAEEGIVEQLIASSVIHVDETGMRGEGKRQWVHVVATTKLTHYAYHAKRGSDATDEIAILPGFKGTAVHDFWKSYLNYKCEHALCNAHHLRELTGIMELTGQKWPQEMIELLLKIKDTVTEKEKLAPHEISSFETEYDRIVAKGFSENPPPVKEKGKRGRTKQGRARNMLNRLHEYRRETLAFMYDPQVPFDNNLAERDLRMLKVKQKISGVFRSELGAKMFCRIRGYISTARKNSVSVLDAIKSALAGKPFVPEL